MTVNPYRQVGPLIPASPFRRGDLPKRNAELTVYALGPNEDDVIPALRVLGEFDHRKLRRFQGALPVTITLPTAYYDKSNTFVALLRASGTKFRIRSWSHVCPDEIADDAAGKTKGLHWCTGTCPTMEIEEVIGS